MCKKQSNIPRNLGLTNIGSCRNHWESIKTCNAQPREGNLILFFQFASIFYYTNSKVLIKAIITGNLSIYDFAIDCCKSKGVPRLCRWSCVPGGMTPKSRKRLKCGRKYGNEMYECKKGEIFYEEMLTVYSY